MTPHRDPQTGMTLAEVLVALAVFAVIGTASFALLDQTLRSQRLSEARLARLEDLQRMMRVVTLDTMQAMPGSLAMDKTDLRFLRRGSVPSQSGPGTEGLLVQYRLDAQGLQRRIGPEGSQPRWQILMPDVRSVSWQPIRTQEPSPSPTQPIGLDLTVELTASESIRGVFALPSDPTSPAAP